MKDFCSKFLDVALKTSTAAVREVYLWSNINCSTQHYNISRFLSQAIRSHKYVDNFQSCSFSPPIAAVHSSAHVVQPHLLSK